MDYSYLLGLLDGVRAGLKDARDITRTQEPDSTLTLEVEAALLSVDRAIHCATSRRRGGRG